MFEKFDDSDMKIAGEKMPKGSSFQQENETVNLYEIQRQNGNLAKAQRIGATLVERIGKLTLDNRDSITDNDRYAVQKKLLMIFGFVVGIEEFSPNKLLVRTSLNVFYDTLKKEDPALYESMGLTGAFSFYYLEYRRKGDITQNIANAFAMLCGAEGDIALVESGADIFGHYFSFVKALIAQAGYVQ